MIIRSNIILASPVCSGHGAASVKVLCLTILTCVNLLTKSYRRQRRTDICSWPTLFGFTVIFFSLSLHKAGIFQSQALSSRPKGVHLRVITLVTFSCTPSIPRKHFLILLIIKALFFFLFHCFVHCLPACHKFSIERFLFHFVCNRDLFPFVSYGVHYSQL